MRILMLTSSWPLCQGDYRGSFVRDLAADLAERGILVDVAVPAPAAENLPPDIECPQDVPSGVSVHWLPVLVPVRSRAFHKAGIEANLKKHPLAALSIPPTLFAFTAECALIAPFVDVIVSNWLLPMGAVGAVLSGMTDKPHLVIAHSAPPLVAALPAASSAFKAVVRSAASVACVSESVRERTARIVGQDLSDRLTVRHLGIDLQPVVRRADRQDRPFTVLFAGRLIPLKGADLLIRAARGVENCRLVIAGDGPESRNLKALASLLDVPVEFCGELDRAAVRRRMALADLLVIPSRRGLFGREEGLPRVLVEAWATGLPVVASTAGGMKNLVDKYGGGRLFDAGDVADLRRRILEFRDNPDLLASLSTQAMAAAVDFDGSRAADGWAEWISGARP